MENLELEQGQRRVGRPPKPEHARLKKIDVRVPQSIIDWVDGEVIRRTDRGQTVDRSSVLRELMLSGINKACKNNR